MTKPANQYEALLQAPDGPLIAIGAGECWLWLGTRVRGYGRLRFGGRTVAAHRALYEARRGPIPDGFTLDHLCARPPCINPDHMEPCTVSDNLRRRWDREGRADVCPRGHPYEVRHGRKRCVTCERATANERGKRRRLSDAIPQAHGLGGYTNFGCRCDVCRVGMRRYKREWKKR